MNRAALLLAVLAAGVPSAFARQTVLDPQPLRLASSGEGRAPDRLAMRARKADERRPAPAARRAGPTEDRTFHVQNPLRRTWSDVVFTLVADRPVDPARTGLDRVRFWVDANVWSSGTVQESQVISLAEAVTESTPADATAGILANTAAAYGAGPDTDGDGTLEVLLFDIEDDHESPSGLLVLGYFSPTDYDNAAPPGEGNRADVLYLDTDPQLTEFAALLPETFARIQARQTLFVLDSDEDPFVARGLADWTRRLSGYPGEGRYYLDFGTEHGIGFFFWSESVQYVGDIQRASLFMSYLGEQFGSGIVSVIARHAESGQAGIRAVLSAEGDGRTLEDVVFDFHVANFLNDPDVDPRFGHRHPAYAGERAVSTYRLDAGPFPGVQPLTTSINGGGVQYVTWENVRDMTIEIRTDGIRPVRVRAVLERTDGSVEVRAFDPDEETDFDGTFEQVTAVVFYAGVDAPASRTSVVVDATWQGPGVATEYVAYDDGTVTDPVRNFALLGGDFEQSTRFEVPTGLELHSVYVSPFFRNQFFNVDGETPLGDPSDPRDLTLRIHADEGGEPGTVLYERVVQDPRSFHYASRTLRHFEVPLHEAPDRPTGLPPTIHVGLAEAGSDMNVLVFAMADYAVENVSHLSGSVEGTPTTFALWDLTLREQSLAGTVIPIRAQFRAVATSTASPPVAHAPRLEVYPNPAFDRVTVDLGGDAGRGRTVTVFDLVGRRVAEVRIAPGSEAAGVDVGNWAAGVYVVSAAGMPARPLVVAR